MRQLIARPGRNAVRQAKKLQDIRKVTNAIKWHEKERKKRQKLRQEQYDSKQAVIQRIKWDNEHVHGVRKKALAQVKEDWRLGPLRPNRAFGEGADKYGVLTAAQVRKPDIPLLSVKNRNEFRERKGLAPEYPLIVDDKKYFPIVKEDRVAILKGKEKGKIGVVEEVMDRTHQVIVKGLNMQYYDNDLFNGSQNGLDPKHEAERPIDIADVRLVVPYERNQGGVRSYTDAIVEQVQMERHTTGIDPFTGTDYGDAEIPKDHQYDPKTGLPIFHRYIAGTRQRIQWPWETRNALEYNEFTLKAGKRTRKNKKSLIQRTISTIRHPITSIKSWTSRPAAKKRIIPKRRLTPQEKDQLRQKRFDARELKRQKPIPRSQKTERRETFFGVDSTRNIVENADSTWYTLVEPPFPQTLSEELRGDIHDRKIEVRKAPDAPPKVKIKRENVVGKAVSVARQRGVQSMKTPMQLRWEMEQARKLADQKKNPLVETEALLAALGEHMVKSGVKIPKKTRKVEEVDVE
ncbi:hypothetical protein T440DRAFT_453387 [Plenodomus tracheiphilus IPT5]|uniref:KOW domain-containing protein n=1 Tax=Plenodomus tracheiphilus IPT5 TaxID=1408161 RepID=A0A6A7B3Q1_9PLEO|nr:hypothetical protein T440DRAFT_453387 [Plenodomus tracheiphilus IPT5]